MTVDRNLVRAVNTLSDEQWGELVRARGAFKAVGGRPKVGESLLPVDADDGLVIDAIATTLANLGVEYATPQLLRKHPNYTQFRSKCGPLLKFLRQAAPTHPLRVQQRALLMIAIELLYRDMSDAGLATSGRTLMNHIHRVPAVLNRHLPGYASSGLLGWVLKPKEA